jgi:hypothetical protein
MTAFFIVTAMKASNLIFFIAFLKLPNTTSVTGKGGYVGYLWGGANIYMISLKHIFCSWTTHYRLYKTHN